MKQIIHIHVGQSGVQMGQSLWKKYCQEHGIDQNGKQTPKQQTKGQNNPQEQAQLNKQILFSQNQFGVNSPLALMIDTDPTIIEQLSKSQKIFSSQHCVKGKQSCASLFSRGFISTSRQILDECLDKIRKQTQKCESFAGFVLQHSICGGTGSGFMSELLHKLDIDYDKKTKVNFTIYPSENMANQVVQPYNAVLSTISLLENSDIVIPLSNQKLYDIHTNQMDLQNSSYFDINHTISQICSTVTLPMRSNTSVLGMNLTELSTNLIPYPRLHFISASYAPFRPQDSLSTSNPSVQKITQQAFNSQNLIINVLPSNGKYIANQLIYRGNVSPFEVLNCQNLIEKTIKRVDWVPRGYKYSIINKNIPKSYTYQYSDKQVCMLSNTTAIKQIFSELLSKFDSLYYKRAFVWWYVADIMEGQFNYQRESLSQFLDDYQEAEIQS